VPLTIVDTTPPDFEVTSSPSILAPADHRLVPIDVTALVADVVDPDAGFVLVSVGSSERDSGLGPGDLAKDIQGVERGTPDTRFLLRAENFSRGEGRVYTIKLRRPRRVRERSPARPERPRPALRARLAALGPSAVGACMDAYCAGRFEGGCGRSAARSRCPG
jgi:hypothetical protein